MLYYNIKKLEARSKETCRVLPLPVSFLCQLVFKAAQRTSRVKNSRRAYGMPAKFFDINKICFAAQALRAMGTGSKF